jgi:hypothetical protein
MIRNALDSSMRGSWCSQIRPGSQLSNHLDRCKLKFGDQGTLLAIDVVVVGEKCKTRRQFNVHVCGTSVT